jgi:hypothetical protein
MAALAKQAEVKQALEELAVKFEELAHAVDQGNELPSQSATTLAQSPQPARVAAV